MKNDEARLVKKNEEARLVKTKFILFFVNRFFKVYLF